ncbi:hypothetical protein CRG98_018009 [Punica granatum]|uniref:Uncharacterized protein n=1 Tax=Punica granatum TaxID=22663 RepID=A0A2I0JZ73_PUNGR|nr:hypothetical protein CRG98_018009 [Punica granatum]
MFFNFGSLERPMKIFVLAIRTGSRFIEASKASVGHTWAYQDILNDAPTALSIVRRTRQLGTLLVKLGIVLYPMYLFETPRLCIAEAALRVPMKDGKEDDALGDCVVEYAVKVSLRKIMHIVSVADWWTQQRVGWDHPSVGGAIMQMTFATVGLGHALSVGAVSGELASPEKVGRPTDHDSPYHGGRMKTASSLSAKVVSTHLNLSVIDPSVGEVDHGGCARREGCPGRRAACILRWVGEVLVGWRTLSRCKQEAK